MNNTQVIDKGLKLAFSKIDTRAKFAMARTCEELVDQTSVPVWTYNLQDSVGAASYTTGGTIDSYVIPTMEAQEPRSGADSFPKDQRYVRASEAPIWGVDGIDKEDEYWGTNELSDMIADPSIQIKSNEGWALAYFAAMPYSQIIDKRQNFMEDEQINPIFLKNIRK
jgi:hypothetical protein